VKLAAVKVWFEGLNWWDEKPGFYYWFCIN